jgi:hypothetical protein
MSSNAKSFALSNFLRFSLHDLAWLNDIHFLLKLWFQFDLKIFFF